MKIEPSFVKLKFGHIRPTNNPYLRLSQLADFLRKYQFYCSEDFAKTENYFKQNIHTVEANPFWRANYSFQTKAKQTINIGLSCPFKDNLWVNAYYRFMFLYFNAIGKKSQIEALLKCMEDRKAEVNFKTKRLKEKIKISTLADSQAAIQWYDNYCVVKKCLQCPLGVKLLR